MSEYVIRLVAGGAVVSLFALLGDVLRPKSFAGLRGAAPSVALVSLAIAFAQHGGDYVRQEAQSMVLGAIALGAFSLATCHLIKRADVSVLPATAVALVAWFAVAFGLWDWPE